MRRRDVMAGLLVAATMGRAQAQQTAKVNRIVIAGPSIPVTEMREDANRYFGAFFKELRRKGYVEGQNLAIERYSRSGRSDVVAELVRDAISQSPDLIFAANGPVALGCKAATTTIPIVGLTDDPVALGLVSNLARPGGNVTGVSIDAGLGVWGKRLELLRETSPRISKVGFLASRDVWESHSSGAMAAVREIVQKAGMSLLGPPLEAIEEAEYRRVFAAMAQEGADALMVFDQPANFLNRRLIVDLAERGRLPAIYGYREHVELGVLMAYAFDLPEVFRLAADEIDQILKGAKPGDIPFYQVTKFELVINLRTAKVLGLTIPPSFVARADEVIE
jgi:putative tryptophan/tyrosine transport system substrate-binding protein